MDYYLTVDLALCYQSMDSEKYAGIWDTDCVYIRINLSQVGNHLFQGSNRHLKFKLEV